MSLSLLKVSDESNIVFYQYRNHLQSYTSYTIAGKQGYLAMMLFLGKIRDPKLLSSRMSSTQIVVFGKKVSANSTQLIRRKSYIKILGKIGPYSQHQQYLIRAWRLMDVMVMLPISRCISGKNSRAPSRTGEEVQSKYFLTKNVRS